MSKKNIAFSIVLTNAFLLGGCGSDRHMVFDEGSTEENNASVEVVHIEDVNVVDVPGTWSMLDGGEGSEIKWDVDGDKVFSRTWLKSAQKKCGGFCGTVVLGKSSSDKVASVGFNLDLSKERNDTLVLADVSSWGQLCVEYASGLDVRVDLESMDSTGVVVEDSPTALYKKTSGDSVKVRCVGWEKFKPKKSGKIPGLEAVKRLVSLSFYFEGSPGMSGYFNIRKLGALVVGSFKETQEEKIDDPPADSLADSPVDDSVNVPVDSSGGDTLLITSSESSADTLITPAKRTIDTNDLVELWDGSISYEVKTEFWEMDEYGAPWYAFDDHVYEGSSTITWPVSLGGGFDSGSLDEVIEECLGICGTIEFGDVAKGKPPFVGVVFDVKGSSDLIATARPVDVTPKWDGVCVVYKSDMSGAIVLDPGLEKAGTMSFQLPEAVFESSSEIVRKCALWSDFTKPDSKEPSDENVEESLASVRIKFDGSSGSGGSFAVYRVEAVKVAE